MQFRNCMKRSSTISFFVIIICVAILLLTFNRRQVDDDELPTPAQFFLSPQTEHHAYTSEENALNSQEILWGQFVNYPMSAHRNLDFWSSQVSKSLIQCPADIVTAENKTACDTELGMAMIEEWQLKFADNNCESNSPSKVVCYDSSNNVKFCTFENSMLNLKRMVQRQKRSTSIRQFEKGFLSTDCGAFGKEDLDYFHVYKPDIDGSSDATCSYIFNETALLYSHENVNNMPLMVNDMLNIWSTIEVLGIAKYSKDITLINVDGLRKGKFNNDKESPFFSYYKRFFRRVVKVSDFESRSQVCFKKLIMPTNPTANFLFYKESQCSMQYPSAFLQRWNLHLRYFHNMLHIQSNTRSHQVLLLTRSPSAKDKQMRPVWSNIDSAAKSLVKYLRKSFSSEIILVRVLDVSTTSFEEQVRIVANASVVVGLQGGLMISAMHLPIGSKDCCGAVEIVAPENAVIGRPMESFSHVFRYMGIHHAQVKVDASLESNTSDPLLVKVPLPSLHTTVRDIIHTMKERPTCVNPTALD